MSSENYVRIIMAERLRFLEEGSSAPSKSEAKVRRKRVADAQTVEIPLPQKDLSKGTLLKRCCRVLVTPVVRERNQVVKSVWTEARKALCISSVPVPQTDTGR